MGELQVGQAFQPDSESAGVRLESLTYDTSGIALEAVGLCKAFGSRIVLDRADLRVAAGETIALGGANGSGKTTLLGCLATALRPTAGEVRWFGRPAAADASSRRLLGMVAHENFLYPHLTVRENLVFAARMCGVPEPLGRADQWLDGIGLRSHAHRPTGRLSKGMRQRLAVARALVHEPRIVLMDEPFSGLDVAGSGWLTDLLGQLRRQGRTVCFTTHDDAKARSLADRLLVLRSGRLWQVSAEGTACEANLPAARAA